MPVAPPPMSSYTRLHDPVAHARSEQEAKEVRETPRCWRAVADCSVGFVWGLGALWWEVGLRVLEGALSEDSREEAKGDARS